MKKIIYMLIFSFIPLMGCDKEEVTPAQKFNVGDLVNCDICRDYVYEITEVTETEAGYSYEIMYCQTGFELCLTYNVSETNLTKNEQ